jgi:hypothetical protein
LLYLSRLAPFFLRIKVTKLTAQMLMGLKTTTPVEQTHVGNYKQALTDKIKKDLSLKTPLIMTLIFYHLCFPQTGDALSIMKSCFKRIFQSKPPGLVSILY